MGMWISTSSAERSQSVLALGASQPQHLKTNMVALANAEDDSQRLPLVTMHRHSRFHEKAHWTGPPGITVIVPRTAAAGAGPPLRPIMHTAAGIGITVR